MTYCLTVFLAIFFFSVVYVIGFLIYGQGRLCLHPWHMVLWLCLFDKHFGVNLDSRCSGHLWRCPLAPIIRSTKAQSSTHSGSVLHVEWSPLRNPGGLPQFRLGRSQHRLLPSSSDWFRDGHMLRVKEADSCWNCCPTAVSSFPSALDMGWLGFKVSSYSTSARNLRIKPTWKQKSKLAWKTDSWRNHFGLCTKNSMHSAPSRHAPGHQLSLQHEPISSLLP